MKETTNFGASTMKTLHGKMLSDDELLFANKVTLTYRGNIFYPCILDASSPLLKDDADSDVKNELYALNAEISQFGVILDRKAITNVGITLSYLSPSDRAVFYEAWIEAIRASKGADKHYIPFYPGFPQQVKELSEFEWMFNAVMHYISDGHYYTTEAERIQYAELKKNRKFAECLEDMKNAKPIGVSTLDDIQDIAYSIMAAPTSISDFDKEIINFFIENIYDEYINKLPEMSFKENMCYVLSKLMRNDLNKRCTPKNIGASIKTATDVLRLYVALSDGDISLSKPTKFKNLPMWQYRVFSELINGMNFNEVYEDTFRYAEMWKRANEKIHPKRFKKGTYTKVAELLYKGEKPITFMTKVNKAFTDSDYDARISLLSQRPGVFARYLDYLIRAACMRLDENEDDIYRVINAFKKVSTSIDTRLLLQVKNHFINRLEHVATNGYINYDEDVERYFINKNGKVFMKTEDYMWNIPEKYIKIVIGVIDDAIKAQYATRDIIGPVYIDPSVDGLLVPWNQRTASTKSKSVVKGSHWKLKDDTKIIRAFCWWTNTPSDIRIDEDISATFVNDFSPETLVTTGRLSENVYYGNIRNDFCVHSGDIVNGGPTDGIGACEFIDIDIDGALDAGYRYAFVSVHSFTAVNFCEFNSTAGFMERTSAELDRNISGMSNGSNQKYNFNIFDPKTVEMNFDLNTEANGSVPILIDLKERQVYWIDSDLNVSGIINCRSSTNLALISINALLKRHFTTIREVVELNAAVRGGLTDNPDDAKTIITATEMEEIEGKTIISAYELDKIMGLI